MCVKENDNSPGGTYSSTRGTTVTFIFFHCPVHLFFSLTKIPPAVHYILSACAYRYPNFMLR